MTRLIDADALILDLNDWQYQEAPILDPTVQSAVSTYEMQRNIYEVIGQCIDAVKDAPTIDAVEVVRCKDCRYFKKIAERSKSGLCHRDIVASARKENGYCSRGERKGGKK